MYSTLQLTVSQLHSRGFTTKAILANTNIDPAELDDPWPTLSYAQYRSLVSNIYNLTQDPAIGLHLNEHFRTYDLGIPGFAALTSETFSQARKIIMDYRVVKDPFIFLSHSLTNNQWTIAFHGLYPAETFIYRFSMEGQIIRAVRFCQDLTGHNHSITAIHLNYPAPDYAEEYQILLPCPVYFDQEENSITFDPTILGDKLPAANKAMNTLCTHDCNIKLSQLESKKSFRNKVYEELFRTFSQEKNAQLSLINVANRLYISPRTLRRKLLTENTSFKIISNDARRDLAIYYLSNTALSTKEISFMLGYSSVNNFHRAFKQWTGKPISEFNQHTD